VTHLLRYTGIEAKTFAEAGTLEPGAEFAVEDHRLAGFTRRTDVEHAAGCLSCAEPAGTGDLPVPESGTPARKARKAQDEAAG